MKSLQSGIVSFCLLALMPVHGEIEPHNFKQTVLTSPCETSALLNHAQESLSLFQVSELIANHPYPVIGLYQLWKQRVIIDDSLSNEDLHPLNILNKQGTCAPECFEIKFIHLCSLLGFETRLANVQDVNGYDIRDASGQWQYFDLKNERVYLGLDNKTLVSSEQIMDDPFIALRADHEMNASRHNFEKAWSYLAHFDIIDPTSAPTILFDDSAAQVPVKIKHAPYQNTTYLSSQPRKFDFEHPHFDLSFTHENISTIKWQISNDPLFRWVSSNLDRTVSHEKTITLTDIDETFLNAGEIYYFRAKSCENNVWSEWSPACMFVFNKPASIEEPELDNVSDNIFEITWQRFAEPNDNSLEYLIFASNSIDFIPSIYTDKQINSISRDGEIETEVVNNLVAVTHEPAIRIGSDYSYYRVIAKRGQILSTPSEIIHIYDRNLNLPRNVLQLVESKNGSASAQRVFFPSSDSCQNISLPTINLPSSYQNDLTRLNALLNTQNLLQPSASYNASCPPGFDEEAWQAVQPWLMPSNHPCKAKLDRLASETRFILNPKVMKQAGFPRAERVGRWSRVCASTHHDMPKYYFKIYHDCEVYIKYDWKRWVHRCQGADLIRNCIKKNHLENRFKAPRKWIYPWPVNGKQPPQNSHYVKKNFILVCDNMQIHDNKENKRLYKHKVDAKWMDGIYTILQECGLYDSVYCFNIPFNKDGYICIIDTEYWHKWRVPFERLTKNFSKKMQPYWEKLISSGKIPDGKNSPDNLPRQDRRDH